MWVSGYARLNIVQQPDMQKYTRTLR